MTVSVAALILAALLPRAAVAQNDPPEDPCTAGDTYTYRCPTGREILWCTCQAPECHPDCLYVGSKSEGWYDSCTGERYEWDICEKCEAECRHIGTFSEGWYDTCDDELIVFAGCGGRWSCLDESLFDADRDGDTLSSCEGDCDDEDAGARQAPAEVEVLFIGRSAATLRLGWSDLAPEAGSSTVYQVAGGRLDELALDGGYASAFCIVDEAALPGCALVPTAVPPGAYFLVRAANACGTGTYGDSGLPSDPRDGLDDPGLTPCP